MAPPRKTNTMKFSIVLTSVVFLSTSFLTCGLLNCEKGTGPVVERAVEVEPFHGLAVQGSMGVRLTPGPVQRITVEGQSNLIDLLTTEVKHGIWRINTRKCFRTNEPFVVHITMPTVDFLSMQGSGDITCLGRFSMPEIALEVQGSGDMDLNVEVQRINALIQGSGSIDLQGTCGTLSATVQGSGDIDADALTTRIVEATVQGSGDISALITDTLTANIGGSGNIRYTGRPAVVNTNIAGSGEVKQDP